ncbi:hypothetical protein H4R18_002869 [Coemansia javaensis]|uniref:GATA-type domain-containing protein n=1 Tax=Coemansia javaensis TaxID=2761396 RepID=A0A9W8H9L9_9FUNG|nr:hypothetical protein H4R18_002869 [Coemansia javaensis]
MAPILLKIKGTKLFSPFNEIEDVGDLSTLWRVCTKVKDSLENGSRLENLSWRLWHLHQTLEARGKGRDYRKLSPTTTKQLEKTIRRPSMHKTKPMQIKVRLGKASDGSGHAKQPPAAAAEASGPSGPSGSGAGSGRPRARPQQQPPPPQQQQQQQAASCSPPAAVADDAVADATPPPDPTQPDPAQPGPAQPGPAQPAAHPLAPADSAEPGAAEEEGVHASDFMSFGPSSFLSSGFDLDAPQIEITLDDIFSANSADWSQFGFAGLGGMPVPGYGGGAGPGGGPGGGAGAAASAAAAAAAAAHGMWGGMGYPVGAPYGPGAMHAGPERPDSHEGPVCHNCGVTSTPLWRRSVDDTLLCNACGLYYKLHRTHRPKSLRASAARKDGADDDAPKTYCTNCKTSKTPLWRRDEAGSPLCNACGLYYKLHKENRPISLKSDVIRKRQRHDAASTTTPRKRQSRAAQKQPGPAEPLSDDDSPQASAAPAPARLPPAPAHPPSASSAHPPGSAGVSSSMAMLSVAPPASC